jgi:Zn-dependent metalloprotease
MKQINLKKLSFVVAVLVLLAFGTIIASAQDNRDPIDAIRAFIGNPALELKELSGTDTIRGLQIRTYSTLDGASTFSVDVQRQQVVLAILANTQSGGGGISHDQALQAAQAFATSRVTEFQRMSLIQDVSGDHGTAGQQYSFLWAERLGTQQAIGLKRVAITVDAGSGAVLSFMQIPSERIVVNVEPTVSRDQALAIAQKQFGAATVSQSATLDMWWRNNDRTQPQLLRWTVTLDSHVPLDANAEANQLIFKHVAYIIDAHTGDIIEELQ